MPRKRNIKVAPAPLDRRSDGEDDDYLFDDDQDRGQQEPQHRNAANARERARMRVLSKAFCRLKTTLPWVPADTKLSKLDTLRLAASYIAHLRALLQDEPRAAAQMFPHPLNLAWPFAFQQGAPLNCTVTQRWRSSESTSPNQVTSTSRTLIPLEPSQNCHHNLGDYSPSYDESGYSEREGEDVGHEHLPCNNDMQYYNCQYTNKDNYYAIRNTYTCDSVMNNV